MTNTSNKYETLSMLLLENMHRAVFKKGDTREGDQLTTCLAGDVVLCESYHNGDKTVSVFNDDNAPGCYQPMRHIFEVLRCDKIVYSSSVNYYRCELYRDGGPSPIDQLMIHFSNSRVTVVSLSVSGEEAFERMVSSMNETKKVVHELRVIDDMLFVPYHDPYMTAFVMDSTANDEYKHIYTTLDYPTMKAVLHMYYNSTHKSNTVVEVMVDDKVVGVIFLLRNIYPERYPSKILSDKRRIVNDDTTDA